MGEIDVKSIHETLVISPHTCHCKLQRRRCGITAPKASFVINLRVTLSLRSHFCRSNMCQKSSSFPQIRVRGGRKVVELPLLGAFFAKFAKIFAKKKKKKSRYFQFVVLTLVLSSHSQKSVSSPKDDVDTHHRIQLPKSRKKIQRRKSIINAQSASTLSLKSFFTVEVVPLADRVSSRKWQACDGKEGQRA